MIPRRHWHPQPTPAARDFHARYFPTPPAGWAEVWALTGAPVARTLARHTSAAAHALLAALLAGWRTYRRMINA